MLLRLLQELPCGHFMHSHCFEQYTRYNYTCPVCSKSLGDMSVYFRMIDSLVLRDIGALPSAYRSRMQARCLPVILRCSCLHSLRLTAINSSRLFCSSRAADTASALQDVLCNDCEQKSQAPFHFVYHCCSQCQSYNTRVL